ncbi:MULTISPECIES: helix-turn-helix transcriptional regulator [unclassified Pseudovibrio]|uniref:helix-turn-helix transcriptional regulator n=1 Tax=unclassified Pseudovibrio TaxID=2627060 RepID=UPI0007111DA6|nr:MULTISPECIES: helix-turn-helix transcriptional regulator [unclassified Pseudovibrio]KZL00509.1 Helix-turn-helix domain protein [Pseudovibrio sp. W74]KZL07684.1 Helix-turn-helix domain protein [Pseudovibrio sp. Ad14]
MEQPAESSNKNVSERLKWLREHYNISTKELATSIGASYSQMANWENGTQRLSLKGALAINSRYGTSLDFLFLGRAETLPTTMAKAWASRPLVSNSNRSNDNPEE